jgi:hypothetical protein
VFDCDELLLLLLLLLFTWMEHLGVVYIFHNKKEIPINLVVTIRRDETWADTMNSKLCSRRVRAMDSSDGPL